MVGKTAEYWTTDKEKCSTSYLDQKLEVKADITSPKPFSLSATTNFTVVKVDVTLDGVDEEKEEAVGAFLKFDPTAIFDNLTADDTWLAPIAFKCEPNDLPTNEMLTVTLGDAYLYELIGNQIKYVEYIGNKVSLPAHHIKDRNFFLQGRVTSGCLRDKQVKVEHIKSQAVDLARYTSVSIAVEPINPSLNMNPCGLIVGGKGKYLAESVLPSEIAAKMEWTVTAGSVTITSEKQNLIIDVSAGMSVGPFQLNYTMKATNEYEFSTYHLPPAFIKGRVIEKKYVPVSFIIIGDISSAWKKPNLAEVNKFFEQVGIEFYEAFTLYEDNPLRYFYDFTSLAILDTYYGVTDVAGTVPITCVQSFRFSNLGGACMEGYGIVLRDLVPGEQQNRDFILAHELGHMCSLKDIYKEYITLDLNTITWDKVQGDWSGGKRQSSYYLPNHSMSTLILDCLLMNGLILSQAVSPDLSLDFVTGMDNFDNGSWRSINTGLLGMNRNPVVK
jgi:hypothetical protein